MLLGPVLDSPASEWDQMLAVNVQGLLHVTHAALPHLVASAADSPRRVADLVTISSTAGRIARPGEASTASPSSVPARSPSRFARRCSVTESGSASSSREPSILSWLHTGARRSARP